MKQVEPGQIVHGSVGTMFYGKGAVDVFRAITVASALRLYARTGMKANRAYTPTAMLRVAEEYVGHPFKRGQYEQAAAELSAWAAQAREGMDMQDANQRKAVAVAGAIEPSMVRPTEPDAKPILV